MAFAEAANRWVRRNFFSAVLSCTSLYRGLLCPPGTARLLLSPRLWLTHGLLICRRMLVRFDGYADGSEDKEVWVEEVTRGASGAGRVHDVSVTCP